MHSCCMASDFGRFGEPGLCSSVFNVMRERGYGCMIVLEWSCLMGCRLGILGMPCTGYAYEWTAYFLMGAREANGTVEFRYNNVGYNNIPVRAHYKSKCSGFLS